MRGFALGILALGVALALNTLLGPLLLGAITYPFSETVQNETLGLEAVSLLLVAPLCVAAGIMAWRGRIAGAVLALAPSAYAAYMLVQYVVGPTYGTYAAAALWHVALLSLAGAVLLWAWTLAAPVLGDGMRPVARRRWAAVLLGLALFVLTRWTGALAGMLEGTPLDEAYRQDPGMYWSIFLLDLGVIVPALAVSAVGLWRGRRWARTAVFALVGWFALVPPSVTAMALTKVINGDPYANPADTVVLGVATLVFTTLALVLYVPVLNRSEASVAGSSAVS